MSEAAQTEFERKLSVLRDKKKSISIQQFKTVTQQKKQQSEKESDVS